MTHRQSNHARSRYLCRYLSSLVVFVVPIPIVNCSPATPTATAAVFIMFVMFGVICMTHRTGYSELWRLLLYSQSAVIVEVRATNLH